MAVRQETAAPFPPAWEAGSKSTPAALPIPRIPCPNSPSTLPPQHHQAPPHPLSPERRRNENGHSLPILHIAISLRQLGTKIDNMAAKQQIILWLDRQSVAHKGAGIQDQGARHAAGYATSLHQVSARGPRVIWEGKLFCAQRWHAGWEEGREEEERTFRDLSVCP